MDAGFDERGRDISSQNSATVATAAPLGVPGILLAPAMLHYVRRELEAVPAPEPLEAGEPLRA